MMPMILKLASGLVPGQLVDVVMVDPDHILAHKTIRAGETMRMRYDRVQVLLSPTSIYGTCGPDGVMESPAGHVIWGRAIWRGVPGHVHVPAEEHQRDGLHYGLDAALVKRIEVVS